MASHVAERFGGVGDVEARLEREAVIGNSMGACHFSSARRGLFGVTGVVEKSG
jgi:hypothetical protein